MSIEALSPGINVTGSVVVREARVWMHTPLSLHMPCANLIVSTVSVMGLREAHATVIRSNWFGPKVIVPVSAKYLCAGAAFAVESELISDKKATPKTSAIDNVILRFIVFLSFFSVNSET